MAKLYILGNGFDLWHGLPTSYDQFYLFAKELLDEFEEYYAIDIVNMGPWSDFENSLGHFRWQAFYATYNHIDVTSENFKPSEAFGLEDELAEQADSYVEGLRELFREWVEEIDVSVAERKLHFSQSDRFITFNYTSTLQSVYGIDDERVSHVHGRADKFDELVFGHGETMEEDPELDENGDSNHTMFSDAEAAAKYPFYVLKKPVQEVLEKNQKMFLDANQSSEIVVIGHSFNYIDLPYFKEVAAHALGANWILCCYREEEKMTHVGRLVSCGVPISSIQTCTYSELQDKNYNECA